MDLKGERTAKNYVRDYANTYKGYVSVIIFVYNAARYLKRCICSICEQTFRELEIIVIDDGSDDGTDIICDEMLIKDQRIKVIHEAHLPR